VAEINGRGLWRFRVRIGGRRAHLLLNFLCQSLHAFFHIRNIVVILGPVVLGDDASILPWGVQGLLTYYHAPVNLLCLYLSIFRVGSVVLIPRVINLEPLHMLIDLGCLSLEVCIRCQVRKASRRALRLRAVLVLSLLLPCRLFRLLIGMVLKSFVLKANHDVFEIDLGSVLISAVSLRSAPARVAPTPSR